MALAGHPLHAACHLGAEGEVRALLQADADCNGQVGDDAADAWYRGTTPLIEAADDNGDGKLSASEILTLHTHTEAESSFREHDTNKVASQRDSNPRRAGFADRHR